MAFARKIYAILHSASNKSAESRVSLKQWSSFIERMHASLHQILEDISDKSTNATFDDSLFVDGRHLFRQHSTVAVVI